MINMQKIKVIPLNAYQNAKFFKTLMERSSVYPDMLSIFSGIINCFDNEHLSILSIGAKDAIFDMMCLQSMKKNYNYTIIENDVEYLGDIYQNLKGYRYNYININFDENTNLRHKFDIIMMKYYSCDNLVETIRNAATHLTNNGKLIVFHQTFDGICQFNQNFSHYFQYVEKPLVDQFVSLNEVSNTFNLKYGDIFENAYCNISNWIDLREILDNNQNIMHQILSYFLQFNSQKLSNMMIICMLSEIFKNLFEINKYHNPLGIMIINHRD